MRTHHVVCLALLSAAIVPADAQTCGQVWNAQACSARYGGCSTCGRRIEWLKRNRGMSDGAAKRAVAGEFPRECGPCGQADAPAGGSSTCQWNAQACSASYGGCSTCGSRIEWLKRNRGMGDGSARATVAGEFPRECGGCAAGGAAGPVAALAPRPQLAAGPVASATNSPFNKLVWSDEFNGGSLDMSKWSHQTGQSGWGNKELQNYRPEQTSVYGGTLKITADNKGGIVSSRIRSINKGDWRYGRFEVRAKLPRGRGSWPGIWMMPTDEVYGWWPRSGEIDIMEAVGYNQGYIQGTVHTNEKHAQQGVHGCIMDSTAGSWCGKKIPGGGVSDTFHTYRVDWTANSIKWYVDGVQYHQVNKPGNAYSGNWPFDQRFHFILNVAVGGTWGGTKGVDYGMFPTAMEVDWARVYQ